MRRAPLTIACDNAIAIRSAPAKPVASRACEPTTTPPRAAWPIPAVNSNRKRCRALFIRARHERPRSRRHGDAAQINTGAERDSVLEEICDALQRARRDDFFLVAVTLAHQHVAFRHAPKVVAHKSRR